MKPGIYTNISFEHYAAIPAFSNTWAGYLEECPAILRHNMDYPERKETPALKVGKAVHEAVFEPESFALKKNFAVSPGFGRTKVEQEAKERFLTENTGKTIIDAEDYEMACDISQSVLTTKTAKGLLKDGSAELTIVWTCPETGVLCKGRVDYWNKQLGLVIDLKTMSESLHDDSLARVINARKYYRQVAWYGYGLDLLGEPIEQAIFIFVQKRKPYPVRFKSLDFESLEQGKREMKAFVKQYAECLENKKWPSYPDTVSTIGLPEWAKKYASGEDFNLYTDKVHEEMSNES